MARRLLSKPNVAPEDSDFIYGRIKDDDGSNNGTPVDEEVYGDFHQFFARLLDKGNITPNDLPDCVYSGFQYFEALSGNWNNVGATGQPIFQNSWVANGSGYNIPRFKRELGWIVLGGAIKSGSSGTVAFTLPPGFRPAAKVSLQALGFGISGGASLNRIDIDTTGDVTIYWASNGNTSLENLRFPVD